MVERGGNLEGKEKEMEMIKEKEMEMEIILPRMVLRVLLVEADDSTRQIIAALLRKCSYRVAAVADGLEAWETLQGGRHKVDLILTEVELPSISGYALLTLIMEHDICKNIPVIMMSSKDSISLVLKCMLKGAADFLIKPIRKNELKNLWQHVWRRQIEPKNVPKPNNVTGGKDVGALEDNREKHHSSDELAYGGINKKSRGECSDSQSSCGKPYLDAETSSMQDMPCKLHVKRENGSSMSDTGKHGVSAHKVEQSALPKNDLGGNGKYEEVASHRGPPMSVVTWLQEDHACVKPSKNIEVLPDCLDEKAYFASESNCQTSTLTQPASGAIDMIGKFDGCSEDFDGNSHAEDGPKKVDINPELELSLRQMHHGHAQDERTNQRTLHPSKASAFSRYKNYKALQPPFPVSASSFPPPMDYLNQLPVFLSSPGYGPAPSNGQDYSATFVLGQSEQPEATSSGAHLGFVPIPGVRFDCGYPYPPFYYVQPVFPPFWSQKSRHEESPLPTSSSIHSSSEVNNPEQAFYLNNESTHYSAENAGLPNDKQLEMGKTDRDASPPPYLSNDLTSKESNGVAGRLCSVNEGNAVLATAAARPTESVNDNSHLVQDGAQGKDSHCTSLREAALLKFRMKRKDRCYDKKVRYQSRKKLAEQRPRVKGQFVRHVQNETSPLDAGDGSSSDVHNT